MPLEVDYLPIANAGGANVETQAAYAADATLQNGYPTGIVPSAKFNKSWRQLSVMVAAIANYISQQLNINVLDDGNVANLVTNLASAITTGANIKPARIVTTSTTLVMTPADYRIGLQRTVGLAAMNIDLPVGAQNGQEFVLEDLLPTLFNNPATAIPPAGHNIVGEATWVMNQDRGSYKFTFYTPNTWSVA